MVMLISATIHNNGQQNDALVQTEGNQKTMHLPVKLNGLGSAVNGGELLFLALATCYCNDIYREAPRRNITIRSIEVTVSGEFGTEGDAGSNIRYEAVIDADCSEEKLQQLMDDVDRIAEVHNTLRKGTAVTLVRTAKA
jgi:uncharacterized OsmC-like protein